MQWTTRFVKTMPVSIGIWLLVVMMYLPGCDSGSPNMTVAEQAFYGEQRSKENSARDVYRHPKETLGFFGVQPGMTVVEVWPGTGWYSEILAPLLAERGQLYAAHFSDEANANFKLRLLSRYKEKLASADVYDRVILTVLDPPRFTEIAPAQSADLVLTFRNVHNWMKDNTELEVFEAFYRALKPGGILGVVEHRANEPISREQMIATGYVSETYTIELAKRAGFTLLARSEINANPSDEKNYPEGVWTLPPTLRLGEVGQNRYLIIGESDRMTLKFQKPITMGAE